MSVSLIYHSPSQNKNEFHLLLSNVEIFLSDVSKACLSVVTGDFNVRSSYWWFKDNNSTEGLSLFSQTSSNSFSQLINEPTHI